MRLDRAGGEAVRRGARWARGHLLPRHRATVPAGIALGCLIVTAAALAGPIGLTPLPAPEAPDPAAAPGTALTAAQPQVRQSLLASADLPPGYAPTPPATGAGPREGLGSPSARSGEGTRTRAPGRPGHLEHPATTPPETTHPATTPPVPGLPEALPVDGDRACARLFGAPWEVAAHGRRLATAPELADHVDPARGVHLRQALGAFDGDGAAAALAALRDAADACPRFTATLGDGTRVDVTLTRPAGTGGPGAGGPSSQPSAEPLPEPSAVTPTTDRAYAVDVGAVADDGRRWTGYLAADRVGPVLSVLWHLGPAGTVTAEEAVATRRAAVDKARPLARMLGGDG